jgi:hypothetical protein
MEYNLGFCGKQKDFRYRENYSHVSICNYWSTNCALQYFVRVFPGFYVIIYMVLSDPHVTTSAKSMYAR